MLGNPGTYANKKRKKPVLKQKKVSEGNEVVKSNPSKRHRDRLNGELDRLTDLLPFADDVRSRLDKLSVLRLSVGYLRVKSHFKATMKNSNSSLLFPGVNGQNGNSMDATGFSEGDLLLQALNGFVMVVTSEGLMFYVSPTIKDYLGFQQSDVVHQSVFELIHTDDRATFREQLHFALNPSPVGTGGDVLQSSINTVMYSPEQLPPENSSFLERNFVCRFRCLLDNSSGFLALKFQGRLKYLHGQSVLRDNGTCTQPQLALFAIAMPVQPPSIVEIRAKMLLFQSKHKLDFTPMGIDNRGKLVLGYSEIELCMKGSGYQFIHAADMMYCADNHIRMIKTGESGLTVFRLLSKSGGWVWVKANAKLVYKGGRPEFIIAYQRALANAEGEEYLRQRRLQLPFSITTGEAILYNTGPTVDIKQFQFNKLFGNNDMDTDVAPGSLLDCFLRQDDSAYTQVVETPLPVDQVFMDSRALVSVPSDTWQENGAAAMTEDPVVVKEEAKQSVMTVIDSLEEMAQNGDFCAALQNLEVSDAELMELENTIKRLSQEGDQQNNVRSELDSILTNDIFDYIDSVLFKEKADDCLNANPSSCLTGVNNNQQDPFTQAARLSTTGLCEQQLFQTPSPDRTYSPMNGLYAHQQDTVNEHVNTGKSSAGSAQIFSSTQKLSHQGPLIAQADTSLPPLQHLQLQDIFSPSIELPELTVPGASTDAPFQSCGQASMSNMGFQPGSTPFAAHNHQVQQWPQSQQQKLHHPGIMQNGHQPMPTCHSQISESQTFPRAGLWPRSVNRLNHTQQGELTCGQAASQSSCMFSQHFSSSPAGGDTVALSRSSCQRGVDASLDQSPPQGSCYFQWSHSEPVVGTSAINQENANISPLTIPPNMSSLEHALNIQHYLECRRQTQDERVSAEHNGIFATPARDVAMYLSE
eukprot:superscaffoldBa00000225_g2900